MQNKYMKYVPAYKKLNQCGFDHLAVLVVFVVLFALIGTYLLIQSHAEATSFQFKMWLNSSTKDTKLCMDDSSSSNYIISYPCKSTDHYQQWTTQSVGKNKFIIKNVRTGQCVDDYKDSAAGSPGHWPPVISYKCSLTDKAQIWSWEPDGKYGQLKNAYNNGCINDPGGDLSQQRLIMYPCSGLGKTAFQETVVTSSGGGTAQGGSGVHCGGSYGGQILYNTDCYYWSSAFQDGSVPYTATGASVTMSEANPKVVEKVDPTGKAGLSHSIMEMWVSTADTKQVAEIGWYKDPGDSSPVLFATDWVNSNCMCFINPSKPNATGYVQVSKTVKPGNKMPLSGSSNFAIKFINKQVQYWWNGAEIGYVPITFWSNKGASFTSIQYVSVYGEVVNGFISQPSTIQMGNGVMGNASGSATFSNFTLYGATVPTKLTDFTAPTGDAASHYSIGHETTTGFTVGGPGY